MGRELHIPRHLGRGPPVPGEVLGGVGQRLQVALDDGVDEDTGVLRRVPLRHVNHVRLHDQGRPAVLRRGVESRHRLVVGQTVVAADDPEAQNVLLFVQDL